MSGRAKDDINVRIPGESYLNNSDPEDDALSALDSPLLSSMSVGDMLFSETYRPEATPAPMPQINTRSQPSAAMLNYSRSLAGGNTRSTAHSHQPFPTFSSSQSTHIPPPRLHQHASHTLPSSRSYYNATYADSPVSSAISAGGHRSGHDLMVTAAEAQRRRDAKITRINEEWQSNHQLCKYAPLYLTGVMAALLTEVSVLYLCRTRSLVDVTVVGCLCIALIMIVVTLCCTRDFYLSVVRKLWWNAIPMAVLCGLMAGVGAGYYAQEYWWHDTHLKVRNLSHLARHTQHTQGQHTPMATVPVDPTPYHTYTFSSASYVDTSALQVWETESAGTLCLAPIVPIFASNGAEGSFLAVDADMYASSGFGGGSSLSHSSVHPLTDTISSSSSSSMASSAALQTLTDTQHKPSRRISHRRRPRYPPLSAMDPSKPVLAHWVVAYNCCSAADGDGSGDVGAGTQPTGQASLPNGQQLTSNGQQSLPTGQQSLPNSQSPGNGPAPGNGRSLGNGQSPGGALSSSARDVAQGSLPAATSVAMLTTATTTDTNMNAANAGVSSQAWAPQGAQGGLPLLSTPQQPQQQLPQSQQQQQQQQQQVYPGAQLPQFLQLDQSLTEAHGVDVEASLQHQVTITDTEGEGEAVGATSHHISPPAQHMVATPSLPGATQPLHQPTPQHDMSAAVAAHDRAARTLAEEHERAAVVMAHHGLLHPQGPSTAAVAAASVNTGIQQGDLASYTAPPMLPTHAAEISGVARGAMEVGTSGVAAGADVILSPSTGAASATPSQSSFLASTTMPVPAPGSASSLPPSTVAGPGTGIGMGTGTGANFGGDAGMGVSASVSSPAATLSRLAGNAAAAGMDGMRTAVSGTNVRVGAGTIGATGVDASVSGAAGRGNGVGTAGASASGGVGGSSPSFAISSATTTSTAASASTVSVTCPGWTTPLSYTDAIRARANVELAAALEAHHRSRPDLQIPKQHVFLTLYESGYVSGLLSEYTVCMIWICVLLPIFWPVLAMILWAINKFAKQCVRRNASERPRGTFIGDDL